MGSKERTKNWLHIVQTALLYRYLLSSSLSAESCWKNKKRKITILPTPFNHLSFSFTLLQTKYHVSGIRDMNHITALYVLKKIPHHLHHLNQVDHPLPCCSSSGEMHRRRQCTCQHYSTSGHVHTSGTVHVQYLYLWEFVKTWQVLIWVIFPVLPIIEVHTQPVALQDHSSVSKIFIPVIHYVHIYSDIHLDDIEFVTHFYYYSFFFFLN